MSVQLAEEYLFEKQTHIFVTIQNTTIIGRRINEWSIGDPCYVFVDKEGRIVFHRMNIFNMELLTIEMNYDNILAWYKPNIQVINQYVKALQQMKSSLILPKEKTVIVQE